MFQVARTSAYAGGCLEPDPRRYIWIIWGGRGIRRFHLARSTSGPTNFAMQPVLDPEPILRYGCTMPWRMPLLCYGSATWGVILQSQLRGCLPMCHLQSRCSGPRPSSWNLPQSFSRWLLPSQARWYRHLLGVCSLVSANSGRQMRAGISLGDLFGCCIAWMSAFGAVGLSR